MTFREFIVSRWKKWLGLALWGFSCYALGAGVASVIVFGTDISIYIILVGMMVGLRLVR